MAIWTQADIDALKAVVGTGVLTVHYSGPPARTVTYQSTDAMEKLLAKMIADVDGDDRIATTYAYTRKGF